MTRDPWAGYSRTHPAPTRVWSARPNMRCLATGRFTAEVRSYGVYAGQSASDLSAYSRTIGAYQASDGQLTFPPDTLVEWDRFYGAAATPSVRTPYPYTGYYDATRYTVASGVLTLQYLSYPADAPVETTQQFHRVE